MENTVYQINKGVNRPIEFKGLQAQYIWYMAGAVILLLLLFTALYAAGVHAFACAAFILIAGGGVTGWIYRLSNRYGPHGLMKALARRYMPDVVRVRSRAIFRQLEEAVPAVPKSETR